MGKDPPLRKGSRNRSRSNKCISPRRRRRRLREEWLSKRRRHWYSRWQPRYLIYSNDPRLHPGPMKLLRVYRLINCHWCRRSRAEMKRRVPRLSLCVCFSTLGYICHLNFIACAREYTRVCSRVLDRSISFNSRVPHNALFRRIRLSIKSRVQNAFPIGDINLKYMTI